MRENLEKNMFAIAGSVSTLIFWYCAFTATGTDVSQGLIACHSLFCFFLAYLRKKGKYSNLKDIKLKTLEVGMSGVKVEMQSEEDKEDSHEI